MTTATITRLKTPLSLTRPDLIARWLWAVAAMVLVMVVIGGITRLTASGLSITEWKPISGTLPPLTDAQWQAEFAAYQHSPQYQLMNQGMSLAAFKHIFFWEYLHRLWGRVIGMAFALPLLWFALKQQIPKRLVGRLVLLLILGGLQGGVGWLMVKSGLAPNMTAVSPPMLAAHFAAAMLLLGALVWTALDCRMLAANATTQLARVTPFAAVVIGILALQIIYGSLMAGLHAGLVANTWPLMNDHLFPRGVAWDGARTFTNDPYLVHFIHRWWAWGAFLALMLLARRVKPLERKAAVAIHISIGVQILLGIATVMSNVALPLAVLHQLTGALTVCATIWGAHVLGRKIITVS